MNNPFGRNYPDHLDSELVKLALGGDRKALQNLVIRHQVFVYNLALKMSRNVEDAEDLAQEVFIKAMTSLGSFQGKSQFRTWLYRITVNHFLNSKKRKSEFEIQSFESYFEAIDNIPEYDLSDQQEAELGDTIEDLKIRCTSGMLMCLDREQRLIYILGEMFEIDHNLGAEIMAISAGNFRIRLMRARKDLYEWMNKRCSLVNSANPCKCSKKTKSYIASGLVDPDNLKFNSRYKQKMYELSEKESGTFIDTMEDLHKKIFLDHPLQTPINTTTLVDQIFNNDLIKTLLKV